LSFFAEEECGEPRLEVVCSALHVGIGVCVQNVQTAAESDECCANGSNPNDGVALVAKEQKKGETNKDSYYAH
jgi:hypothetical protein